MLEKYCILFHYHEISLKGKNRSWFERQLIKNIKIQLRNLPLLKIELISARIFCHGIDSSRWSEYVNRINKIMGIKHATLMEKNICTMDAMEKSAINQMKGVTFKSFRVTTKRQWKDFSFTSQQVNEKVGEKINTTLNKLVKLKNPEMNLLIEIVDGFYYMGYKRVLSHGGLPVGTSEHAISMISSGIDSPVASFQMLKRGVNLSYVHFHSVPATNRQSIKNVEEIVKILCKYQIKSKLYMVPLLKIQQKIMEESSNKLWVILFRRAMIKISSILAQKINAPGLVTGESIGQVASQTLSNIMATSDAADRPIFRPLCGMNKENIVTMAQEIGTYELSIEPYEDCCSFFVPNHPETKADLDKVIGVEAHINLSKLMEEALNKTTATIIKCSDYLKKEEIELAEING